MQAFSVYMYTCVCTCVCVRVCSCVLCIILCDACTQELIARPSAKFPQQIKKAIKHTYMEARGNPLPTFKEQFSENSFGWPNSVLKMK